MNVELKYITTTDMHYVEAKKIRIACFFEGMANAVELIHDPFEGKAIHLVCVDSNHQVIGTGRVHTNGTTGIISQMAIKKEKQRTGVGKKIVVELMDKCKSLGMEKIELSARETAVKFYEKVGFESIGAPYASLKTGIPHQHMRMLIHATG